MWCCAPGHNGDAAMTRALQDHVKATIAPYKYPRAIEYRRRAAEDADRQAAALRTAQDRRRAGARKTRVVGIRTNGTDKPTLFVKPPEDDELPRALLPQGWPRPQGYANGMTAKGRVVVTGGVVGWDVMGNFPDTFAAPGAPDVLQHPENPRRGRRRTGASGAADLVRHRSRRVSREPEGARPRLSRDDRHLLSRRWRWCRSPGWSRRPRRSRSRRRRSFPNSFPM